MSDQNQSLIGLTLDELGQLETQTTHRDGTVERQPLETDWPTDRPHTWRAGGPALDERLVVGLSRKERIDQSLRVEAALVKATCSATGLLAISQKNAPAVLAEVLLAMGGEWATLAQRLTEKPHV